MKSAQSLMAKVLRWFWWVGWAVLLGACSSLVNPERAEWETYQNERYNFAFPYPDTWLMGPVMDNLDGREFRDPSVDGVSIRGWASQVSGGMVAPTGVVPDHEILPNFTTEQGVAGRLNVTIGEDVSNMQLVLIKDGVVYYWEARSPSDLFDDYFRFFYYVAEQYRLEAVEVSS